MDNNIKVGELSMAYPLYNAHLLIVCVIMLWSLRCRDVQYRT